MTQHRMQQKIALFIASSVLILISIPPYSICASKRLLDVVLATFGIVVLIPIFLVIAVAIKLEDGGNIFYFREMIGFQGRRFIMLKFRTMIPNADTYLEQNPELKLGISGKYEAAA